MDSNQYLTETLFQAKRHALPPHYIKNLEFERNQRLKTERELLTEKHRSTFHHLFRAP